MRVTLKQPDILKCANDVDVVDDDNDDANFQCLALALFNVLEQWCTKKLSNFLRIRHAMANFRNLEVYLSDLAVCSFVSKFFFCLFDVSFPVFFVVCYCCCWLSCFLLLRALDMCVHDHFGFFFAHFGELYCFQIVVGWGFTLSALDCY